MFNASFFSHEIMAHKRSYLSEELWLKTFLWNYSDIIKISLQMKLQNQLEIIENRPCLFSFVWWIVFLLLWQLSWNKNWACVVAVISFWLNLFACLFFLHTTREKLHRDVCWIDFWPKSMVFNGSGWIVQILEIIKFWSCLSSYSNTAKVKNVS